LHARRSRRCREAYDQAVSARVIDGKAIAARVRGEVAEEVRRFGEETGTVPGLATVLVGDDEGSAVYVAGKQRACREVGMRSFDERLAASASAAEVGEVLERLNEDPEVSGVLLQLPLPDHLDGPALTALIEPAKDVDGLTPVNAGLLALGRPGLRPCTPAGVLELLRDTGVELDGIESVVVGRSNLFGKPMVQLLLEAHATVTTCHSHTRELPRVCSRAELLIVAAGRPRMITPAFVGEGAVVIDVGINRLTPEQAGNRSGLVGDVDFDAVAARASAISPVPGGVGPMTIAMLLRNTLQAAHAQARVGAA
jgi:methylenetetrahydrofolate dehydrogenase (NADP+) / methenyltetrahydrofolate cyclohydrolase